MRLQFLGLVVLACLSSVLHAQPGARLRYDVYGGYSFLSNSFNGIHGSHQPLNGWDASLAFPPWRSLRFKIDTYAYRGTNLGAPQHGLFILGGGEYGRQVGRERVFAEAFVGDVGLNRDWGPQKAPGGTAAIAMLVGGGLDTPISRHFAYRVTGGFQYVYTAFLGPPPIFLASHVDALPTYFARISTGLVWRF